MINENNKLNNISKFKKGHFLFDISGFFPQQNVTQKGLTYFLKFLGSLKTPSYGPPFRCMDYGICIDFLSLLLDFLNLKKNVLIYSKSDGGFIFLIFAI